MRKILRKGADGFTKIFPPQFLLLALLYVIWYGGNAALIGFVLFKLVRTVSAAFFPEI